MNRSSATGRPTARHVLILAALFVLSLPLVTPRLYASDEVQYFSYLRSLWFDRDVSFENEYQHFYDSGIVHYAGFHETFLERETETGRRVSFATIGSALLWSPFYGIADVYVRIARGLGSETPADGYSQPYVSAVAYASAFYAWVSLVCAWLIGRRVLGEPATRDSFLATLAIWIGTPLFFYMYIAPPMAHACSAFAVALFVLTWLHVREHWSLRGMLLLGALAGLMAMVREQDLFIAIGPAIDWTISLWRGEHRRPSLIVSGIVGAAAFAIAYTPQLAAYMALNGYPGPSRLVARKMNVLSPHALETLASTEHGLLFWTPLIALSLLGLVWLAIKSPRIALCTIAIVASQIYIAGAVESWTVAGAFGQRRFVGLSSVFVLGLAAFLVALRAGWPRRIGVTLVAVGIWWNLGLMAQFGTGLMDRQRLELGRNAYNTFVTIPLRVPDLAYRYVFARRSFYRPPSSSPSPSTPEPPSQP